LAAGLLGFGVVADYSWAGATILFFVWLVVAALSAGEPRLRVAEKFALVIRSFMSYIGGKKTLPGNGSTRKT